MLGKSMPWKTLPTLALTLAGLVVFAVFSAAQQERPSSPAPPPCPQPFQSITQTIPVSTSNLVQGDFIPAQWSAPRAGLNDHGTNKHFLGHFQWKSERPCCQVTWGRLIVQMKSNSEGHVPNGSDAGNDSFSVMAGPTVVYSKRVYTAPPTFPTGTPATVNWILNSAALTKINSGGGLSFDVQDDTMVTSATLELRGCCMPVSK